MFQKLLYLAEAHVGVELGGQYQRHAAGPHAPMGLREIERIATEQGWFSVRKEDGRYMYAPGPNIDERLRAAEDILGDRVGELDRLVHIFGPRRTEYAEVVATLFAAWNDLLMDGRDASPDEIITEIHSNWHERKLRFGAERLRRALRWMRDNNIVPTGRGPRTEMVNA
jgi:type I restriction enzyme S subunit